MGTLPNFTNAVKAVPNSLRAHCVKSLKSRAQFRNPGRRAEKACQCLNILQTSGKKVAAVGADRFYRLDCGTTKSGIGVPWNRRRQGFASHRAQRLAVLRRALSVAIPVLAYICR